MSGTIDFNELLQHIEIEKYGSIDVLMDCSGSIGAEVFYDFLKALNNFQDQFDELIFFDTTILESHKSNNLPVARPVSGGGTDLCAAMKWLDQNKSVKACIVLTDGYVQWPEPQDINFPVVTVLTTDVEGPRYGKTVRYNP